MIAKCDQRNAAVHENCMQMSKGKAEQGWTLKYPLRSRLLLYTCQLELPATWSSDKALAALPPSASLIPEVLGALSAADCVCDPFSCEGYFVINVTSCNGWYSLLTLT